MARRVSVILALCLLVASRSAVAAPLRLLADLTQIVVWEETTSTNANVFAPNDAALLTQLPLLGAGSNDFTYFPGEYYDVFYSDADGTVNNDGGYLTIEGVWTGNPNAGSMNINEVQLVFGSAPTRFGDYVASFVLGSLCPSGPLACNPASVGNAVDGNLSTFPSMGGTNASDPDERFRLTIGFDDISDAAPVPEPASLTLLGLGLAGVVRKRFARRG